MALPVPRLPSHIYKPALKRVPTQILRDGRSQWLTDRGENLAEMSADMTSGAIQMEDTETPSESLDMYSLSREMDNPPPGYGEQGEPNKFLTMLGTILKPLTYLDIPVELTAEVIEGVIPGKWWGEGTAEREDWEGWKALGDLLKGDRSIIDAADAIAHAYEKRPLMAQLGLGLAYGLPISRVGTIARLGRAAKPLMYTLDPAQAVFDYGIKPVVKKGWKHRPQALRFAKDASYKGKWAGRGPVGGGAGFATQEEFDEYILKRQAQAEELRYGEYVEGKQSLKKDGKGNFTNLEELNNSLIVPELKPFHKMHNSILSLRRKLLTGTDYQDYGIPEEGVGSVPRLVKARDLALLDLEQAVFGREGQLNDVTVKELEQFLIDGFVPLTSTTPSAPLREGFQFAAQLGPQIEAKNSVRYYLELLKNTEEGSASLYDALVAQNAPAFKAVHQELSVDYAPIGDTITGVNSLVTKGNILSSRLRFYNKFYGKDLGAEGIDQPLPMSSQYLRAVAATQWAGNSLLNTSDEIGAMLRHAETSPDEWVTYVYDSDAINTSVDSGILYGDFFKHSDMGENLKVTVEGEFVEGYRNGYFERQLGITEQNAVIVREGKIVSRKKPLIFTDEAKTEMKSLGLDWKKGEEVINNLALAKASGRRMAKAAGANPSRVKKGLKQAGDVFTKAQKEYSEFFIDYKFQKMVNQAKNGDLDSFKSGNISARVAEDIENHKAIHGESLVEGGRAQRELDSMIEFGAVMRIQDDAVQLDISHTRLKNRQKLIVENLQKAGWLTHKGKGVYKFEKIVKSDILEQNKLKYGEEVEMSRKEAHRLWGPFAEASEAEDIIPADFTEVPAGGGWIGYEREFGASAAQDFQNSYGGIQQQTRRLQGQLHPHEIMITGSVFKKGQVLTKWMELYRDAYRIDGGVENSLLFQGYIIRNLWDGVVDPSLATDQLLTLPGVASKINVHSGTTDYTWARAIARLDSGVASGRNPWEAQATGAKRAKEEAREIISAFVYADETLQNIENFNRNDPTELDNAYQRVREWLGVGLSEGVHNPNLVEQSAFLIQNRDAIESARAKLNILERVGKVTDGSSPTEVKEAIVRIVTEDEYGVGQLFGSDLYKSLPDPKTGEKVLDMAKLEARAETLAVLLTDSPDGFNTILGEAGFTSAVINVPVRGGTRQKVLSMRRPYSPTEGVDILDGRGHIDEYSIVGRILEVEDSATSQVHNKAPNHVKQYLLGMDDTGKPLERQNTFHKIMINSYAYMAGGSAETGLRAATRMFIARLRGYDTAELIGKEGKAQLTLMLNHESTQPVLGASRESASRLHKTGGPDAKRAQGKNAVGNRFYTSMKPNEMEWNAAGTDITGKWADGTAMSDEAKTWIRTAVKAAGKKEHGDFMEDMSSKTMKDNILKLLTLEHGVLALNDNMLDEIFSPTAGQRSQIRLITNTPAVVDETAAMNGYFIQEEIVKAAGKKVGQKAPKYLEGPYAPRITVEEGIDMAKQRDNWNGLRQNNEFWLNARKDENPFHMAARGVVYTDIEESLPLYVEGMNKAIVDQKTNYALRHIDQFMYAGRGFSDEWVEYKDGEAVWKESLSPEEITRLKKEGFLPTGMKMNAKDYHKAVSYDQTMIGKLETVLDNVIGKTDTTKPFDPIKFRGTLSNDVAFTTEFTHAVQNAEWGHMGRIAIHIDELRKYKSNWSRAKYLMKDDNLALNEMKQAISDYKHTLTDAVEQANMTAGERWGKLYDKQHNRWLDNNLRLSNADMEDLDAHITIMEEGIGGFGMKGIAQGAKPMSRFLRTFKAGFDAGVLLIHGYNALVKIPFTRTGGAWAFDPSSQKAWFKAAGKMLQFMKDPQYYEEYMATGDNIALRQRMMPYSKLGHSEPLSLLTDSSSFQKWRVGAAKLPVIGGARIAHRAEAAFIGTLDVLRMEMWKAMEDTVKRDFERTVTSVKPEVRWHDIPGSQSREQIEVMTEFGAVVNKATGVYDQTLAGLKPTQGTIEQSLIFFAPMYRRATYGIIADIGRGGMRSREALRQLGGVILAGATMGLLAEHAFGNEGASNPDSGNFGKFTIAGQKMGIGTAWYTAFRLAADIGLHVDTVPEGDVTDFIKDHPIITALGRRGRSQMAPPAQILTDMILGKTYIGEPLMDRDGSRDWTEHIIYAGKQVMPFWADPVLTGGKSGMLGGFAEAAGLQSMPISDYDKVVNVRQYLLEEEDGLPSLVEWRKQQKATGGKLVWSSLPDKVRFDLETSNTQLISAMSAYKQKWGDLARGSDRDWVDYADRKESIDLTAKTKAAELTMQFEKGLIDGRRLNQELKSIKNYRRLSHGQLIADPTIPAVAERFAELRAAKAHDYDLVYYGDFLFDEYMATVVSAENTEDSDGMFIADNYASNVLDFKNKHNLTDDSPMWEYIESRKSAWYQENPVMMELDTAKKTLDPYWNIHKSIFTGEDLHKASRYLGAISEHQKALMIVADPSLKVIADKISRARQEMRMDRPDFDWQLVKWHGARPKTDYARIMEDSWETRVQYNRKTGIVSTPDPKGYQKTGYGRVTHSSLTGVQ